MVFATERERVVKGSLRGGLMTRTRLKALFIIEKQTYIWREAPFVGDLAISCLHFKDSCDFYNTYIAFKPTFKTFLMTL